MRTHWLSNRVFESYNDIAEAICETSNGLIELPDAIESIGMRNDDHVDRAQLKTWAEATFCAVARD